VEYWGGGGGWVFSIRNVCDDFELAFVGFMVLIMTLTRVCFG
jgi:hypothetical protein